jgi:5-methylcytosine-specific restriction endonuclease McrA
MDMTGLKYGKPEPRVVTAKRKEKREQQNERACREIVWKRDKGRCRIPNCNEQGKGKVEMHHVIPRSRSSMLKWRTENNCILCKAHHSLRHAGVIQISGNADEELIITGDIDRLRFRI